MPTWRNSLPLQSDSIEYFSEPVVVRTEMETGPAKLRLRATKERQFATIASVHFSRIQVDEFEDFWTDDLAHGTLSFTWPQGHPLSDASATCRFVSKPRFSMLRGGDTNIRHWMATLELEIL